MRRFLACAAGAALAVGAVQSASAVVIYADDFSEANGTVINGKASDTGGTWVETTTTNIAVQNSAVDTSGAARLLFVPFTRALAAGEVATLTFNSSDVNLFRTGTAFGGISLFSGFVNGTSVGAERMFVGDRSAADTGWGAQGGAGVIQSTNNTLPATVVLTYAFDTGDAALSVNGSQVGTANFGSGFALNALRIANNNGGDIRVNDITVDASPIPEPATAGLLGLAGAGLLGRRRRRVA